MKYTFAPREFSNMISDTLIGKPYIEEDHPNRPIGDPAVGFNCWGLTRHLFKLRGKELPLDVFDAIKLFRKIDSDDYQFEDVLSIKPFDVYPTHVGFVESCNTVIHCSAGWGGVARTPIDFFANCLSLYRLK